MSKSKRYYFALQHFFSFVSNEIVFDFRLMLVPTFPIRIKRIIDAHHVFSVYAMARLNKVLIDQINPNGIRIISAIVNNPRNVYPIILILIYELYSF